MTFIQKNRTYFIFSIRFKMLQFAPMKLVSNQLGPNFTLTDALCALGYALLPGKKEVDFSSYFETSNYKLASTARTLLGLLAATLPAGKSVGIPAVCCAVMATPFLSNGKKVCWLDTDETGLLNPKEVEKHKDELGLILVPHLFGQRAEIERIMEIAKANNIIVVEDGAHFFEPGEPNADYRLLSFGREKDISCVAGGALIWKENATGADIIAQKKLLQPSFEWAFRHASQPLVLALSLPWWSNGGRFIAGVFSKLKVLPRAVSRGEKKGINDFPQTNLAFTQQKILARAFRQRTKELNHRESLSNVWKRKLSDIFPAAKLITTSNFFRVILIGANPETIRNTGKKHGFDLREWDGEPIAPRGVELKKFGYTKGQCPNAEKFINSYITFPTNRRTSLADIERFAKLFN